MATWTMAQAKRDFVNGLLIGYFVERSAMEDCWHILLQTNAPVATRIDYLVDAHKGYTREFKTLDAVVSALEQIGFTVNRFTGP